MRFLLALLLSALPAQAGLQGFSTSNYATTPAQVIDVPCTVSIWIRSNSSGANQCMMCLSDADDDTKMWLGTGGSFKAETMNAAGSAAAISCDGLDPLSTGLWRNVVAVFASTTDRRIYVNGFGGFGSTSKTIDSTIDTLFLGVLNANSAVSNATNSASGLAQVAVWNVALTPQQVIGIYTGVSPLSVARGSLKHWIPCNRNPPVDEVTGATMTVTGSLTLTEDPPKAARNAGMGSDTVASILGSKLVSDYNADSGVTGNPVTAWNDSVGTYHLDNVDGTPDLVAGPNGHSGIRFVAASNEALYRTTSVQVTATPLEVIEVAILDAADATSVWWMGDKDVNDLHCFFRRGTAGGIPIATAGDGTALSDATADDGPAVGQTYIDEAIFRSATDRVIRHNASLYGTSATSRTPSGIDSFAIGRVRDSTPNGSTSRTVLRLLVLNAEPSATERRQLMVLLNHTYGPMVDQEWPIGVFDP